MHIPVRPKPTDAMLPMSREAVLAEGPPSRPERSRMMPVPGSACSQKNMKLRRERSSRKASSSVERFRAWVVADCRAAVLAVKQRTAAHNVAAIRWAVLISRQETIQGITSVVDPEIRAVERKLRHGSTSELACARLIPDLT